MAWWLGSCAFIAGAWVQSMVRNLSFCEPGSLAKQTNRTGNFPAVQWLRLGPFAARAHFNPWLGNVDPAGRLCGQATTQTKTMNKSEKIPGKMALSYSCPPGPQFTTHSSLPREPPL